VLVPFFLKNEKFGLTSQIQRAGISISSNIAAGIIKRIYSVFYIERGTLYE